MPMPSRWNGWMTMATMVEMYCSSHHDTSGDLCADCEAFLDYAEVRLDKCPYGEQKPTCANCPVHCYKPQYRARARQIMREELGGLARACNACHTQFLLN